MAADTLLHIRHGHYRLPGTGERVDVSAAVARAVAASELLLDDAVPPAVTDADRIFAHTAVSVTDETTLRCLARLCATTDSDDLMVLNFASATRPGGGFRSGARAQEESLARAGGLFPCLSQFERELYDHMRGPAACAYSHRMVYSARVPF